MSLKEQTKTHKVILTLTMPHTEPISCGSQGRATHGDCASPPPSASTPTPSTLETVYASTKAIPTWRSSEKAFGTSSTMSQRGWTLLVDSIDLMHSYRSALTMQQTMIHYKNETALYLRAKGMSGPLICMSKQRFRPLKDPDRWLLSPGLRWSVIDLRDVISDTKLLQGLGLGSTAPVSF